MEGPLMPLQDPEDVGAPEAYELGRILDPKSASFNIKEKLQTQKLLVAH